MTGSASETRPERRGSVRLLAASIYAGTAAGLVTGPLIARALGPADRGIFAAISSYADLLTVLVALGIPEALGYEASRSPERRPHLIGTARRYALALVPVGCLAAGLVCSGPLASLQGIAAWEAFAFLALVPLVVHGTCMEQLLRAEGALRPLAEVRLLPFLANAVLVVAAWAASRLSLVLVLPIRAFALASAALWARYRLDDAAASSDPLRPLWAYGAKAQLGRIAAVINVRLDQLVMLPMLGPEALGLYAVAVVASSLVVGVGEALATRAFRLVGAAPLDGQSFAAAETLRRAAVLQTAAALSLMAVLPALLPLVFGRPFAPAVIPALILVPGFATFGFGLVATSCALALGRPEILTYAHGAGLVVTAALLPLLLPVLGIDGAAIVSALSYASFAATSLILLRRAGLGSVRPTSDDVRAVLRSLPLRAWPSGGPLGSGRAD